MDSMFLAECDLAKACGTAPMLAWPAGHSVGDRDLSVGALSAPCWDTPSCDIFSSGGNGSHACEPGAAAAGPSAGPQDVLVPVTGGEISRVAGGLGDPSMADLDQGTAPLAPTTALSPAPLRVGTRLKRKRAAETAVPAPHGGGVASDRKVCATQSLAPAKRSSKRTSSEERRREQNRRHAADCRARKRATVAALQQEIADKDMKIEYFKACCSELPAYSLLLAKYDRFVATQQEKV